MTDVSAATNWREAIDAIKAPLAAAIAEGTNFVALFGALRELMNERCGIQPLVFLDLDDVNTMLDSYDNAYLDDTPDPDDVANALLEMRPDTCDIDDVTWCTQLARLRANKQPLEWWAPLIDDSGLADVFSDQTWDNLSDARFNVLVSAVEKMVADPDSFTLTSENSHVQP